MPIDSGNLALKGLDDLFSTEENRQEEQREQVQQIPIDALHPFTNHPFKVLDDEAMTRTVESIAQYGVLAPLIARPRPDGDGYEIISGHRRQYAAKLAGLDTLPVIVRQMSDDAAVILMHYNPFAYVHSEKDILKLVTTLMTNTKGEGSGGDPFWEKSERLLLTALIAYLHYEAPVEEQNFATLLEMLNTMQVLEDDEEYQNPVDLLFEELAKKKPNSFAGRQYKLYKLAAGDICSK